MSNTTNINFWDATDFICGICRFESEEQCDKCPVRWMCDEQSKKENKE